MDIDQDLSWKRAVTIFALGSPFSRELLDSYADCKSSWMFRINKNQLSGKIPEGVWATSIIDFSDNDLTGELKSIVLQKNRFSGQLSSELGKLIDLEENSLTGSIPSKLEGIARLGDLNLQILRVVVSQVLLAAGKVSRLD
ncbi:hypothetical protein SADUNF_Sadunf13G0083000 [Salix dunnii]|uniref:Uncharacterized protein n=1 Tax=Salix dunnii TaxID=1413687 RepID=A0A835JHW7_9ROSI|nr:hypothetical protein SADUNF_Sadunf13G0083000 [Salix dunnii]